jgi:hypothetical protein
MGSQGEKWRKMEKNAPKNCPHFPAKTADFDLKHSILKGKGKNNVTGRKHWNKAESFLVLPLSQYLI